MHGELQQAQGVVVELRIGLATTSSAMRGHDRPAPRVTGEPGDRLGPLRVVEVEVQATSSMPRRSSRSQSPARTMACGIRPRLSERRSHSSPSSARRARALSSRARVASTSGSPRRRERGGRPDRVARAGEEVDGREELPLGQAEHRLVAADERRASMSTRPPSQRPTCARCTAGGAASPVGEAGRAAHRGVVGVLPGVAQHPLHLGEAWSRPHGRVTLREMANRATRTYLRGGGRASGTRARRPRGPARAGRRLRPLGTAHCHPFRRPLGPWDGTSHPRSVLRSPIIAQRARARRKVRLAYGTARSLWRGCGPHEAGSQQGMTPGPSCPHTPTCNPVAGRHGPLPRW